MTLSEIQINLILDRVLKKMTFFVDVQFRSKLSQKDIYMYVSMTFSISITIIHNLVEKFPAKKKL